MTYTGSSSRTPALTTVVWMYLWVEMRRFVFESTCFGGGGMDVLCVYIWVEITR